MVKAFHQKLSYLFLPFYHLSYQISVFMEVNQCLFIIVNNAFQSSNSMWLAINDMRFSHLQEIFFYDMFLLNPNPSFLINFIYYQQFFCDLSATNVLRAISYFWLREQFFLEYLNFKQSKNHLGNLLKFRLWCSSWDGPKILHF